MGDYVEDGSECESEKVFKPIVEEVFFLPTKMSSKKKLPQTIVEEAVIRCNRAEIPPMIHVGDRFYNARHFRETLRLDAIKRLYDFRFKRNDADRISIICNDPKLECPFKVYASRCKDESVMLIRSMISAHTCARLTKNPQANSTFLAKFHLNKFRDDPNLNLSGLRHATVRELEVEPSKDQLYKCKQKTMNIIDGDWESQYNKLYNYATILLQRNPGSIIKLSHTLDDPPHFKRFFCAFEGLTKGFLAGCRPWIGLDGTFLKKVGQNSGQGELLTAVGRDPNLEIYPIAFGFVEGENFDSWKWFLSCLADALMRPDLHGFTFMSDRQKGLLKVFDDCYLEIEHRYCLRHLYDNLKFKKDLLHKEIFVAANIGNHL